AGRNLTVDADTVVLGRLLNNGPDVFFQAGSAGSGNLLVTGALDATGPANLGAKSGNGGQIVLRSNSSKAFEVGSGATVNGVTGQLVANGRATGGAGGKIWFPILST